ncbi:hypothetical protein Sango_1618600 [Sesamum angolense]|uniref:Reverse transcriptase domain-containing protein n=1 Tax=Sesamum angolense TaxID=2727404 RepID=A0AAE1WJI9_9LAMI|nr:hypothetical protein Sango_1618600 [Sesamum angolense]
MLRQRAKLQWLKGGDQCSKVFFRRVATRRANKRIFQISDDDGNEQQNPPLLAAFFPWARHILTDDEARAIIHPVTIDEVKTAFFDIEEDKAPGPDGFSSGFFKAAWPVVGEEVSKAIIDFFKTGRLLKQLNATLLTLIPKVRTPHSVAEFRPISCCNVVYKVISKILVSRIREILDLLISPSQNAFVPGRLISDNILLAQELFSGYNQCRLPPRCALKVDLRKAYDTVEWDFLIATLRMFGFPAVFIRWIEECVTSAHYSVVVNGGVHGFFAGARGLRQGDPMSLYLFVLVMEVLHMILQHLLNRTGKVIFRSDTLVSHSFQHGFLLQIVKHYFRRLTAALKHDPWHLLGPLISRFPRGPQLTNTGLLDKLSVVIKDGQWNWPMINDIACLEITYMLPPISEGPDRISWKSNDGSFNTSTAYELFHPPGPKVFWSSLLMGPFKIPKNCFILWLAIMGRLSTLDKPWLHHIGGLCILCPDGVPETHDHLLFSCSFSRRCLAIIRQQIPLPWPHRDWQHGVQWASSTWRGKHG